MHLLNGGLLECIYPEYQHLGVTNALISFLSFFPSFFHVHSVVLAAGVLQWVEWRATPNNGNCAAAYGCLSFYDAFYFVIVTVRGDALLTVQSL
jgi:hypothetical protein